MKLKDYGIHKAYEWNQRERTFNSDWWDGVKLVCDLFREEA